MDFETYGPDGTPAGIKQLPHHMIAKAREVYALMRAHDTKSLCGLSLDTAPALTPAQQHAEELVDLARLSIQHSLPGQVLTAAEKVLAKIEPPEPPTLAEALEIVDWLAQRPSIESKTRALDVLDRARRAGLLKGA